MQQFVRLAHVDPRERLVMFSHFACGTRIFCALFVKWTHGRRTGRGFRVVNICVRKVRLDVFHHDHGAWYSKVQNLALLA